MRTKDKGATAKRQAESRKVAIAQNDAVFAAMDKRASENFFGNRGFSTRTIQRLVANGLHLPEELLLMSADEAGRIPGLDSAGLAEVRAYREQFSPRS